MAAFSVLFSVPLWLDAFSLFQREEQDMAVCLVTGGAGFIGSHLVEALVERGDRVRVLDNFCTGDRANLDAVRERIDLIEGDITDAETVRQATRGAEFVFHQAALAS